MALAKKIGLIALSIVTILSFAPLVLALLASTIASALNCPLDESGPHTCLLAGRDIGEPLVDFYNFGWLSLFTGPGILFCAIVWLALLALGLFRLLYRWISGQTSRDAAPTATKPHD